MNLDVLRVQVRPCDLRMFHDIMFRFVDVSRPRGTGQHGR